ncbi:MAG: fumarate hydratase [Deltaproteobacteria bacterium CG07_land_8_20_14_0_80_38_7]|nr:MAG: fumarate hydratase [Deltaproteobacteria bacterium CG07_land_8_20_14_0_80_38_7]
MNNLYNSLLELIIKTSCEIPEDIKQEIMIAQKKEAKASIASKILSSILENIQMANTNHSPICQDTGVPIFFISGKDSSLDCLIENTADKAVKKAVSLGYLRNNSVDPIKGKALNSDNNITRALFYFNHSEKAKKQYTEISLLLKGGGSENVSSQYMLPDSLLEADRSLTGVKKCILNAILNAQGNGCAPGSAGVCIGGDRVTGFVEAKKQFLRRADDKNPIHELQILEKEILKLSNQLDIGPMGLGGKTTLLNCKIGSHSRHPASYFVTVSYMCWAYRRQGIRIDSKGNILKWLY